MVLEAAGQVAEEKEYQWCCTASYDVLTGAEVACRIKGATNHHFLIGYKACSTGRVHVWHCSSGPALMATEIIDSGWGWRGSGVYS